MGELWFCGEVIAPDGLAELGPLLAESGSGVGLYRSGHDGSYVLRASGPVSLDMDAGQGPAKVFSGTVQGDVDDALGLLRRLSGALTRAGLRHRVELYADAGGPLLGYLHHDWPESSSEYAIRFI